MQEEEFVIVKEFPTQFKKVPHVANAISRRQSSRLIRNQIYQEKNNKVLELTRRIMNGIP